jgi:hypothetical protein
VFAFLGEGAAGCIGSCWGLLRLRGCACCCVGRVEAGEDGVPVVRVWRVWVGWFGGRYGYLGWDWKTTIRYGAGRDGTEVITALGTKGCRIALGLAGRWTAIKHGIKVVEP